MRQDDFDLTLCLYVDFKIVFGSRLGVRALDVLTVGGSMPPHGRSSRASAHTRIACEVARASGHRVRTVLA